MPFESISNRRLYRQIARQIIDLIEAGEYKPGERLPAERILAERLAVSRPTVREALLALEVENRVEIRGGSGVFVLDRPASAAVPPTAPHDVHIPEPVELLHARSLIEPEIAALAAQNALPKHLAALAKALGDMVCCSARDSKRLDHDRKFHFALAEAAGNAALLQALKALWGSGEQPVDPFPELLFYPEQLWRRAIIEHREILEAVKQGDAKAARLSMQRHLKNMRIRLTSDRREPGVAAQTFGATKPPRKAEQHVDVFPAVIELDNWAMQPARTA